MSNAKYDLAVDDDVEESETDNSPAALRTAYNRLKRENGDLKRQVAEATTKTRKTDLATILSDAGLKPKLAGLYPADGELTADAVASWAADYADVFGIEVAAETADAVDDATTTAVGAISRASATAPAAPVTAGFDALAKEMAGKTWEQLRAGGLAGEKAYAINGG